MYSERLDIRLSSVELEALDDLCRVWQASRSAILRTLIVRQLVAALERAGARQAELR